MIVDKQNFPFLLEYTHSDDVYTFYSFCYIDDENYYYLSGQKSANVFNSALIINNSNGFTKTISTIKRLTFGIYYI